MRTRGDRRKNRSSPIAIVTPPGRKPLKVFLRENNGRVELSSDTRRRMAEVDRRLGVDRRFSADRRKKTMGRVVPAGERETEKHRWIELSVEEFRSLLHSPHPPPFWVLGPPGKVVFLNRRVQDRRKGSDRRQHP